MHNQSFLKGLVIGAPLSLLLWCGIGFVALHEIPTHDRHLVTIEVHKLAHAVRHRAKSLETMFG